MAEAKAKKKFAEVSQRWNQNISIDQVFSIFKNSEKYTFERQHKLLGQLFKNHVSEFPKHSAQFEVDVKKNKKTPFEAFINFMSTASVLPSSQKPQIAAKPISASDSKLATSTKSDFESPALSSTRFDDLKRLPDFKADVVISELQEKIAQHRQSFYRQSFNSSTSSIAPKKVIPTKAEPNNISSRNWNFSFGDENLLPIQMRTPQPIVGLPTTAQEQVVITELLNVLIGLNGTLIVAKPSSLVYNPKDDYTMMTSCSENVKTTVLGFEVSDQIQESIRDIISDILPLGNFLFQILNFSEVAEANHSGQVLQALSCGIEKLVSDYYTTIAQIEAMHIQQELNLHKMLFYLRPIIQTMETITKVCNLIQAGNIRGGNVLTRLHDNIAMYSGDKNSQKILIYLTQMAAEPYMEMLRHWIFKGIIIDVGLEFFVEDNEKEFCDPEKNFDDYWEKRYVIQSEKIPRFLEKQADVIFRTGKYLNVVRECGKRIAFNQSEASLKFSHSDEQNYVNIINDAYSYASKTLLELIMDDNDLMGHLLSVKRYFLLQQGDFIVQFMEASEKDLMTSVDNVIPTRLENLLELTLRLSSAKHDKYQDNLYTTLLPFDICTQMAKIIKQGAGSSEVVGDEVDTSTLKGIECFTFGYKVDWPLSIVLNQMTISKYQLIFRQLFYCKYVENYLCRVWIANKNAKKFDQSTSELYREAFTLRQRMMNAIQNLEYYMMIEVIEPVWHVFLLLMAKAKNIDDVLSLHEDFLDHCLKNCMLTYPDLLKKIMAVCNTCVGFCEFIETGDTLMSFLDEPMIKEATFSEKVSRIDRFFTEQIVHLLDAIHEIAEKDNADKFVLLSNRINYNHFYTEFLTTRH